MLPTNYKIPTDTSSIVFDNVWKSESFLETHRRIIETKQYSNGDRTIIEWYQGKIDDPDGDFKWHQGYRSRFIPHNQQIPNGNFNIEVAWYSEYRGVTHNVDKDTYYPFHVNHDGKVISSCDASKYGNPNNRHVRAVLAELDRRSEDPTEF